MMSGTKKVEVCCASVSYFEKQKVLDADGTPRTLVDGRTPMTVDVRKDALRGEIIEISAAQADRLLAEHMVQEPGSKSVFPEPKATLFSVPSPVDDEGNGVKPIVNPATLVDQRPAQESSGAGQPLNPEAQLEIQRKAAELNASLSADEAATEAQLAALENEGDGDGDGGDGNDDKLTPPEVNDEEVAAAKAALESDDYDQIRSFASSHQLESSSAKKDDLKNAVQQYVSLAELEREGASA